MPAAYRDEHWQKVERAAFLARLDAEVAALDTRVYARRIARRWAGQTLIGSTALAVPLALVAALAGAGSGLCGVALLLGWPLAACVYLVRLRRAGRALPARLHRRAAHLDLRTLGALDARAFWRAELSREEIAGVAWPVVGVIVSVPLALPLPLLFVADGGSLVDGWVLANALLFGFAFTVAAFSTFELARALHAAPTEALADLARRHSAATLKVSLAASLVTGGILLLVPPLLFFLIAEATIVPGFRWAARVTARERPR